MKLLSCNLILERSRPDKEIEASGMKSRTLTRSMWWTRTQIKNRSVRLSLLNILDGWPNGPNLTSLMKNLAASTKSLVPCTVLIYGTLHNHGSCVLPQCFSQALFVKLPVGKRNSNPLNAGARARDRGSLWNTVFSHSHSNKFLPSQDIFFISLSLSSERKRK